ncbi:MAG: hypothetical protein BroJett013_30640 [Alphaproteobacteria bacterium]|nr:MAG: hypothetical protein BroJett013_30640 [Alphaproteobacteria bacterium]
MNSAPPAVMDPASASWHLDKRVPIALIAAIMTQAAGVVWWGSQLATRVDVLERTLVAATDDRERLVRVETTVQSIDQRLARMEDRR